MSSQEPNPASEPPVEEPPPPPPEDELPEPDMPSLDEAFKEDYDSIVSPEEPVKPKKKKKKRRYGSIVTVVVVLVILLAWTLITPEVMPETGTAYTESDQYSNLGNYIANRDIWAGNTSWGLCFSGPTTASVGEEIEIKVLFVKVSEEPGNFFIRGTSISLRNVSIYVDDGDSGIFLASMTDKTDLGYGVSVSLKFTFDTPGNYTLFLHWKFLVNLAMLIGYMPLEMLTADVLSPTYLEEIIQVA